MGGQKPKYLRIFQENLARIRKQSGLSQEEVGLRIGMKQTQYSKLEVADLDPRLSTIDRASGALDIPLHELFREENPQNLSAENLLLRVLEIEPEAREPLLKVIEGYLRHYEANRGVHPHAAERRAELKAIRAEQKKD